MSEPTYRTYILGDFIGDVREGDYIRTPSVREITLPTGEGAVDRVMQLKYDYIAKTGRQPTVLITWLKFYEQLMGAYARMLYGHSGFVSEIEGMRIHLIPAPVTYVCSSPEVDFSLYRRESNGDQEEG